MREIYKVYYGILKHFKGGFIMKTALGICIGLIFGFFAGMVLFVWTMMNAPDLCELFIKMRDGK